MISLRNVFLLYYYTISLSHGLMLRDDVEHCANVTLLQYRDPPGPMTALAALPGSGSHWVSHLLQMATGIHTGSKYEESFLKDQGFPAAGVHNGSVIVIKDHFIKEWNSDW